jgi:hypothetical protein
MGKMGIKHKNVCQKAFCKETTCRAVDERRILKLILGGGGAVCDVGECSPALVQEHGDEIKIL